LQNCIEGSNLQQKQENPQAVDNQQFAGLFLVEISGIEPLTS
jgi:hypothetical protein